MGGLSPRSRTRCLPPLCDFRYCSEPAPFPIALRGRAHCTQQPRSAVLRALPALSPSLVLHTTDTHLSAQRPGHGHPSRLVCLLDKPWSVPSEAPLRPGSLFVVWTCADTALLPHFLCECEHSRERAVSRMCSYAPYRPETCVPGLSEATARSTLFGPGPAAVHSYPGASPHAVSLTYTFGACSRRHDSRAHR